MGKRSRYVRVMRQAREHQFVLGVAYSDGQVDVFGHTQRHLVDGAALAVASDARQDGGAECVAVVDRLTGAVRVDFDGRPPAQRLDGSLHPFAQQLRDLWVRNTGPGLAPAVLRASGASHVQ